MGKGVSRQWFGYGWWTLYRRPSYVVWQIEGRFRRFLPAEMFGFAPSHRVVNQVWRKRMRVVMSQSFHKKGEGEVGRRCVDNKRV